MSSLTNADTTPSRSEATQGKLLGAGIELFSQKGFEATSTRQVETAAGVQRNLIRYHFGSKEAFWKACINELFLRLQSVMGPAVSQSRDIAPGERIRFLIRQFLRASAKYPEITRIMFEEGRSDDWRLDWLVDNYTKDFYQTVTGLYREAGHDEHDLSAIQFYYLLVSGAAIFAMAPECRRLSGEDPFSDAMIDAQANTMAGLLIRE